MLKKAIERLKLPESFNNLTCNLFTNQKNKVFTAVGTTEPYNVLVGIDQGEIISPLLWCIYYDPLLCQIQQLGIGYTIEGKLKHNIYDNEETVESITFPGLAYMDDTTWMASNVEDLEMILSTADDFYKLNDIQINKEKSELLVKFYDIKRFNYSQKIYLNFGNDIIGIKPNHPKDSTRILGVWFNLNMKKKFVLQQASSEVRQLAMTIKRKVRNLTDKQSLYIFNALIIPKIEYRTQVTFLTENDCKKILAPFRTVFKHGLKFASTCPNAIMDNSLIYNFRNLWEIQRQAKITEFTIQINDNGILGKITHARLKNIQRYLWIPHNPLSNYPFNNIPHRLKTSYLTNMLFLCKISNITFEIKKNINKNILGGETPIYQLMSEKDYFQNIDSLQQYGVLFLEQITTIDHQYFLSWLSICKRNYTKFITTRKKKEQKWYNIIKKEVSKNNSTYELKENYKKTDITSLKGVFLKNYNTDSVQWVYFWHEIHNTAIFGKTTMIRTEQHLKIIQHWLIDEPNTEEFLVLKKCNGCNIGDNIGLFGQTNSCNITTNRSNLYELPISIGQSHKIDFTYADVSRKQFFNDAQLYDIKTNLYYTIMYKYNLNFQKHINFFKDMSDQHRITKPIQSLFNNIITRYLSLTNDIQQLINIQQQFKFIPRLEFYTDGSLINANTSISHMTFGFYERINDILFTSSCSWWPSSFHTELFGIISALIVCPNNCDVTIFTDNQSVIQNFHSLSKDNFELSTRKIFKLNNMNCLWITLIEIINNLNLKVNLIKVKSHSNVDGNNFIDAAVKNAHTNNEKFLSLNNNSYDLISYIPKWKNIPINQNLRNFIKEISKAKGIENFLTLSRNTKYIELEIDWYITFSMLQTDIENHKTSFTASKFKHKKVKLLIEEIPTIQQMKKAQMDIYEYMKCIYCQTEDEDFNHVWVCHERILEIIELTSRTINFLTMKINDNIVNKIEKVGYHDLTKLGIWSLGKSQNEFNMIDLIKGIFPKILTDYI